jgi:hypothetical protein
MGSNAKSAEDCFSFLLEHEFLGEDFVLGVRLPSDSLIWTVKELFPLSFTRGDGVSGGGGGVNILLCGRE